ncbi:hypothetical protein [Bradyrhizobium sp. OAE829]|uniref:hypothetical protein n=1 Tax=Bradyrhizobium sp. OAE829 TaxID=2663807 RepID=UPI00178B88CE
MNETDPPSSRQDRIREAYRRAVGDHDYSSREPKDCSAVKDLLPVIRDVVTDVTLEEVCAVRWEDQKIYWCPLEIETELAPHCILLPTGYPTDPDIVGPFDTYEDAKAFTEAHPATCREGTIRCMATPAFEILAEHNFNAARARFVSKLGVTTDLLRPPKQAPRDVIVRVTPTAALDIAQYLERNCPLPGVQEICALVKVAATTECVVGPRDTRPPRELEPAD